MPYPNDLTSCPAGAGSINDPTNPGGGLPTTPVTPNPYVPPEFCTPENNLANNGDDAYQESVADGALQQSGAPLNVFRLLGVHEQGKLIDLVGNGQALNNSGNAFDTLASNYVSLQTGINVVTDPAWIGYDFGTLKTSYGTEQYAPGAPNAQHITTMKITQPAAGRRALQVRVERSIGNFYVDPVSILFTGTGNGTVNSFNAGIRSETGSFMLTASSSTQFSVFFVGSSTELLGVLTVGDRFNSDRGSFMVTQGAIPFAPGDMFTVPVQQAWLRVDVVNLPDAATTATVRLKQSAPSRYWRIVPISFSGAASNQPWEVSKVEMFDYQSTRLDDIQDTLFMENRDRDYAKTAINFKVTYQPFDAISDLSKFGFQIADTWIFSTTFASMVKALGRPIVIGDVLELPSEVQYDHNLRPVRKFLEVIDTSWQADGYTTNWRPIIFRFQASQLIPGQEHRDILGTVDTQKYIVDDGNFFDGIEQIQTAPLTVTEKNIEDANKAVPERGSDISEIRSGTNRFGTPGSYDGKDGLYVEDGLPPDGQPYTEGFKLPDVAGVLDGTYFRLNYDPATNIPSRLYRFNGTTNMWKYVETDRRSKKNSHKPSQRQIFETTQTMSLTTKNL